MSNQPTTTNAADAMQSAITKVDIAAMKKASDICFRKMRGTIGSSIECNKEIERTESNPFSTRETIVLRCSDRFHSYADTMHGKVYDIKRENAWDAFEMIHSPSYCEEWQTICACLKAGDILSLEWIADNQSGYLVEAGLHRDHLKLIVNRKDKQRLVFCVRESVCQNNSARMIRA
jgi:hypothetical protein